MFWPTSGFNFNFGGTSGQGSIASVSNSQLSTSADNVTEGNRWFTAQGTAPGTPANQPATPMQWFTQDNTHTGPLTLNTGSNVSVTGPGEAQTETIQSLLDTPEAHAVSQFVVNDLKPGPTGEATARVTQVLDVAQPDGGVKTFGKERVVNFQGMPVRQTPSNVQWTSSVFRVVRNGNDESDFTFNRASSTGENTQLQSSISRSDDGFISNTTGTRLLPGQVSMLDGLGGFQPKTETATDGTGNRFSQWAGQQWQHIMRWINGS
jgi:hypothetical protein